MSASEAGYWRAFFELHEGLEREGPGSAEVTERALAMVPTLPREPRTVELGCGPGAVARHLAWLTGGTVVGVELHAPFLLRLLREAGREGLRHRVAAVRADMASPPFPAAGFDLAWSEGALYVVGLPRGLAVMRELVRPGGSVVFSDAVWLGRERPERARRLWESESPGITTIDGCLSTVSDAGLEIVDRFTLPTGAWWDHYYGPLEARIESLRAARGDDPDLRRVLDEHVEEIETFRRHHDAYGYLMVVCRRP